jgi:MFS family permease
MMGFLSSVFHPVSQALMSDVLPPDKRLVAFQLRYTMINLGVAIGPVLGALTGGVGDSIIFLIAAVVYLFYAVYNSFLTRNLKLLHGSDDSKINFLMTLKVVSIDKKLQYFVLAGILFFVCYSQIESTLSQYLVLNFSNGVMLFAYLLATNGFAVIAFQLPVYYLSRRWPVNLSLILGSIILALGFVVLAFARQPWELYLAIIIASIGELFVLPLSSLFIDMIAPEQYKGTYFGASMLRQVGIFLGPILGSFLLQHFGGSTVFLITAIFTAVSCWLNLLGEKTKQLEI